MVTNFTLTPQIVDDIDYNRFVLRSILNKFHNFSTIEAVTGQDCIEKMMLQHERKCICQGIRAIFMDYEMPVLNGIEATK